MGVIGRTRKRNPAPGAFTILEILRLSFQIHRHSMLLAQLIDCLLTGDSTMYSISISMIWSNANTSTGKMCTQGTKEARL